jgi:hypothetical protein
MDRHEFLFPSKAKNPSVTLAAVQSIIARVFNMNTSNDQQQIKSTTPAFRFSNGCTAADHTKIFSHGADRAV